VLSTGAETNSAKLLKTESFQAHPAYNTMTQQNDIAVIRVAEDIVFTLQVGPACLPFRFPTTSVGTVVDVLGKEFKFLKLNTALCSTGCLQNIYFLMLHDSSIVTTGVLISP
jgi:hypothetical protein